MTYNLGEYRYRDGRIYRKRWLFFWKCIDEGLYRWKEGVRKVNRLCGVYE